MPELTASAAFNILSSLPASILEANLTLNDLDGHNYGTVSKDTYAELSKKGKIENLSFNDDRIILHTDYARLYKKRLKAVEANVLPEGAVIFPEENFIILSVYGKDAKNFIKPLVMVGMDKADLKDLDIDNGTFALRKWDEYYAGMYVDLNFPSTINWFVKPDSSKKKYAWVGLSKDEAIDKLYALHEAENVKPQTDNVKELSPTKPGKTGKAKPKGK